LLTMNRDSERARVLSRHGASEIDPITAFEQLNLMAPFKLLFEQENFEQMELQTLFFYTLIVQMKQRGQSKVNRIRDDDSVKKVVNEKRENVVSTTKVLEVAEKNSLLYVPSTAKYVDPIARTKNDVKDVIVKYDSICSDLEKYINVFVEQAKVDQYDSLVVLQKGKVLSHVVDVTVGGQYPRGASLDKIEDVEKLLELPRKDEFIIKNVAGDMSSKNFNMDTYINVDFPKRRRLFADKYYNVWNSQTYDMYKSNLIIFSTFKLLLGIDVRYRKKFVVIDPDLVDVHCYLKESFLLWFTDKKLEKEILLAIIRSGEYGPGPFIYSSDNERDCYYILPYNTCLKKQLYGAGEN